MLLSLRKNGDEESRFLIWEIRETSARTSYRDQAIPETLRFGNHRAGITEIIRKLCHWRRTYYILYSEKIKSCKEAGLHYSNYFPHGTERKTVTVTEIFAGSKEDQHQSLCYSNSFPQEYYAVKFPLIITENNYPKHKRVCNNLSPMGDRFLSSAGGGRNCVLSMRVPNPSPVLDKNCAPMGPEILSSTGAGSGERLLRHFQTPALYWINFSLRPTKVKFGLATILCNGSRAKGNWKHPKGTRQKGTGREVKF